MGTETEQAQAIMQMQQAVQLSALQMRLDTQPLLDQIETYLRGKRTIIQQDNNSGKIVTKNLNYGKAKANEDGVQGVLSWISSIVNPQVVQGNFAADRNGISEQYDRYIEETNIDLAEMLVLNCEAWTISEDEIDQIANFIMRLIIPFMSRLINNKERESYGQTIKTSEVSSIQTPKPNIFK